MDKAFDIILGSEIDAVSLAKTSYSKSTDYFRYECLCCGEEVYLAAANSTIKTPHFRHRRGNNDSNCEIYLGQPGAVERCVMVRKQEHEHVSFYYNTDRMTFEIGISFSEEEIEKHESLKSVLELKTKLYGPIFWSVSVNKSVFIPDIKSYFILSQYSNDYHIDFDGNRYTYSDVIRKTGKITVFRPSISSTRAKKVSSQVLFANTNYIVISEDKDIIQNLLGFRSIDCLKEPYEFITMDRKFYGVDVSIKEKDYSISHFFMTQDYSVETSESFEILWPPVFMKASKVICNESNIYAYSSFPLVYHGNTNTICDVFDESSYTITKITVDDSAVIYERNVDVSLHREEKIEDIIQEEITTYSVDKWKVPDDYEYFIFDQDGCRRLAPYENVYLTETDFINGYKNGHLKVTIHGLPVKNLSEEELLDDIIKYHPQTEAYNPDEFIDKTLSELVINYLEKCYRSGKINTVVKEYIKEGLL